MMLTRLPRPLPQLVAMSVENTRRIGKPTKMLYFRFLLWCVCCDRVFTQSTINQHAADDNKSDRQVTLLEQTLMALDAMSTQLQLMEMRLQTMHTVQQSAESRQVSIESRQVSMAIQQASVLSRQVSMEIRQQTAESRQISMERHVIGTSEDTRCRTTDDGQRTCYKLVRKTMTWTEGRAYCKNLAKDADLVSIESGTENEFLLNMTRDFERHGCSNFFTSGKKQADGTWIWQATQNPFTFTAWRPGEPNNVKGVEDACMFAHAASNGPNWNDLASTSNICAFCEIH